MSFPAFELKLLYIVAPTSKEEFGSKALCTQSADKTSALLSWPTEQTRKNDEGGNDLQTDLSAGLGANVPCLVPYWDKAARSIFIFVIGC